MNKGLSSSKYVIYVHRQVYVIWCYFTNFFSLTVVSKVITGNYSFFTLRKHDFFLLKLDLKVSSHLTLFL